MIEVSVVMPTPAEWQAALSVTKSISEQRRYVVRMVQAFLAYDTGTPAIGTTELTERLWSADHAGSASAAACRKRMIAHVIKAAANDLAGYASRGTHARKFMGKTVYPWLWHGFKPALRPDDNPHHGEVTCPDCGCNFTPIA